jgi:heme/copper-type cytochrome/quinol oxidase subunit 2
LTLPIPPERSRALWRRQVLLTLLVAATFLAVAGLTVLISRASDHEQTRARFHLEPGDHRVLVAVTIVTAVAVVALLAAVCVHAYRIATLTFRRGDDT